MEPGASLGNWVVAWAVIAGLIMLTRMWRPLAGTGLVAAYLLTFGMNHWPGAVIYLQPGYARSDPDVVAVGFQQATYAVAAFGVGSVVLAPRLAGLVQAAALHAQAAPRGWQPAPRIIAIGLVLLLCLLPLLPKVPTLSALLAQGLSLVAVGLGLASWNAWQGRRAPAFVGWLAATLCLPFLTIVTQGFLGYGTVAALAILTFIASFARPRWKTVLAALVLGYLGLSLFVTYMRDRGEIRDTVASRGALSGAALTYQTVATLEWFDWSNLDHLNRIDDRLNQNYLVGQAVTYLNAGLAPFAQFDTVWNGLLALIPRAIWPTKPFEAGSPGLVSRYTGLSFAAGTSVGIGNVMEAFISFGTAGVIVAFLLLGTVIALLDTAAGQRLRDGNWRGFLLWYLPGLSLLQVIGSIVEITSSAGAALVVAFLVTRLVRPAQTAPTGRPSSASRPALSA